MSKIKIVTPTGKLGRRHYERQDEDYIADFILVSRRTLSARDWPIFYAHFVLGQDKVACCERLKLSRGNFFHAVYRIERILGRTFRELEPYSLFPLDEYFGGVYSRKRLAVELPVAAPGGRAVRPARSAVAAVPRPARLVVPLRRAA